MKVYLIKRKDSYDCDEYDSFVVIAKDEESAYSYLLKNFFAYDDMYYLNRDNLIFTEITEPGYVLGSFNRG